MPADDEYFCLMSCSLTVIEVQGKTIFRFVDECQAMGAEHAYPLPGSFICLFILNEVCPHLFILLVK